MSVFRPGLEPSKEVKSDHKNQAILSVSESMFLATYPDGNSEKLAEVGNTSYRPNPRLIEYSPEAGFLVNAGQMVYEFSSEVLFKIKHGLGFISARELFGDKVKDFSEKEFDGLYHEVARLADKKINLLKGFLRVTGIDTSRINSYELMTLVEQWFKNKKNQEAVSNLPNETDSDWGKRKKISEEILQASFRPTGNEFLKLVAEFLLEEHGGNLSEEKKKMIAILISSPSFIAKNFTELQKGSVDLFYLFARFGDFKTETTEGTLAALNNFPLSRELLLEFEQKPDSRFGDMLLMVCNQEVEREKKEKLEGTF